MSTTAFRAAVLPSRQLEYELAIEAGGGIVVSALDSLDGLIWTDSQGVDGLSRVLERNKAVRWVQLPFAGVENFKPVFDSIQAQGREITFTSAKGAYREPVAEHALMLALALARALPERIVAKSWGRKFAATLFDSKILIVGGGGIAEELIRLLTPFRAAISVVRREAQAMNGVECVEKLERLDDLLSKADFIFVTCALTQETRGMFDARRFALMKPSSYLVNIARGGIVVTPALEAALKNGKIAGAGIDVTDPEPLPGGHSLWDAPNLIITPHTADTPEMCVRLLSERIAENTVHIIAGTPLVGQVNLKLGY